jgi:hypothetical protein
MVNRKSASEAVDVDGYGRNSISDSYAILEGDDRQPRPFGAACVRRVAPVRLPVELERVEVLSELPSEMIV